MVRNYTTGENTDNAFSVTANPWSKEELVTYNGLELTKSVKMESKR
ncbi:MAG: hypothetical protein IJR59_06885 [Firmicutes bacterium]|nr:hypothetical protein [Bacillota bacterium]